VTLWVPFDSSYIRREFPYIPLTDIELFVTDKLKLGFTDDPTCERCLEEVESATHIQCDCEAIDYLSFRHLGQYFLEPSDYYDAPINRVLNFIRNVGLIKGNQRGSTIDQ
jgi:hypothetical protein